MVGIILAGGTGTRLGPVTKVVSKQLLPIFDKPMVYFPISLLMASGIREIVIVVTPRDREAYETLLGDGSAWGIVVHYVVQEFPNGLPEAFILSENYIKGKACTLILGDNILYGSGLGKKLLSNQRNHGAHVYGYLVNNSSSFGVLNIGKDGQILDLLEKPIGFGRGFAIPGVYHFDDTVTERSKTLVPSKRGELEIVDLLKTYLIDQKLTYTKLDRGIAWLDTGTTQDLFMAAELVNVVQTRQGMLIGSPDEVAYRNGWITKDQLLENARVFDGSLYGVALGELGNEDF